MFDHKPDRCSFGHAPSPGWAQVSWPPCLCAPARERPERGHLRVSCQTCHDQQWQTTFYQSNVAEDATMSSVGRPELDPPTPRPAAQLLNLVWGEDGEFGLHLWT
jgi:hypothetical protein